MAIRACPYSHHPTYMIGDLRWRRSLGQAIKGSPALSSSTSNTPQQQLLVVPAGTLMVLVDAEDGGVIAHVELGGEVETTPVVGSQGQVCTCMFVCV